MQLRNLIKDYLKRVTLMQVATSKGNNPWACSVYFAFDKSFNLYWISRPTTRHSQELENNKKVAGTIVLPHTHGEKVRGLQFSGKAKKLRGKRLNSAMKIYAKRFDLPEDKTKAILEGINSHTCYMIKPEVIILFDEVNFTDNPRQEYKF